MRKVLLMRPPYYIDRYYFPFFGEEPLGLFCIAEALRGRCVLKILDCIGDYQYKFSLVLGRENILRVGASDKDILRKIDKFKPDVVAISGSFVTMDPIIKKICALVKEYDDRILTLIGGPYPSSMPEIINDPNIDLLVIGEGEKTIEELAEKDFKDFSEVQGVIYKDALGNVIKTPPRDQIDLTRIKPEISGVETTDYNTNRFTVTCMKRLEDHKIFFKLAMLLFRIPYSAFLLKSFYNILYRNKSNFRKAQIITSRGCPNRCSFCAVKNVWGRTYRSKTVETIMAEIDYLVKRKGIREINLVDDNFTVNKNRVIELSKRIREKGYQKLTFTANSGLNISTLDTQVLTALKDMGFQSIYLGLESGNQRVLTDLIRKNLKLDKAKEVIQAAKKIGFSVHGFFMVGFPGETQQEREDTIEFIINSKLDSARLYLCMPYPGSELYEKAIKNGWLTSDYDVVNILALSNAFYFRTGDLSPDKMKKFIIEARTKLQQHGILEDPLYSE